MEFVTHRREDGSFQPLREHMENVARLAAEYGAAFGAEEQAGTRGTSARHRQIQPARSGASARPGAYAENRSRDGRGAGSVPEAARSARGTGGRRSSRRPAGSGRERRSGERHVYGAHEEGTDGGERSFRLARRNRAVAAGERTSVGSARCANREFGRCILACSFPVWWTRILSIPRPRCRARSRAAGMQSIETLLEKLRAQVAPWLEKPTKRALRDAGSEILARLLMLWDG